MKVASRRSRFLVLLALLGLLLLGEVHEATHAEPASEDCAACDLVGVEGPAAVDPDLTPRLFALVPLLRPAEVLCAGPTLAPAERGPPVRG